MKNINPNTITSLMTTLARIDKFLRVDLTKTLSDGRDIEHWSEGSEGCMTILSLRWLLTDEQNAIAKNLVTEFEADMNSVADFFRMLATLTDAEKENPLLLEQANEKIEKTRTRFRMNATALRESLESNDQSSLSLPSSIAESLHRFKIDHPDPAKAAFIMMQFGQTRIHDEIVSSIRSELGLYEIAVFRADDRQYHDDVFANVQTFMHGCGFGIAIYERIEQDEFNPNVSLEVGYMLALGKPILLLKDRTLRVLNTDLVGKLYGSFDPSDVAGTIRKPLEKWLTDKTII